MWGKYSGSLKVKIGVQSVDLPLLKCEKWRMANPEHKRVQVNLSKKQPYWRIGEVWNTD